MFPPNLTLGFAFGMLPYPSKNHAQNPVNNEPVYDAHTKLSKKELDSLAYKRGFKYWHKLTRSVSKFMQTIPEFKTKIIRGVLLDILEYDGNWLNKILHFVVSNSVQDAIKTVFDLAQSQMITNFTISYGAQYKSIIYDAWKDIAIESMKGTREQLVKKLELLNLVKALVSFCVNENKTDTQTMLYGEWQYDFWNAEHTKDWSFIQIEKCLFEIFTEKIDAATFFSRINSDSTDGVNWAWDGIMVAFYGYFNKNTAFLEKPTDIRQIMVFMATFFLVGYINNKSELVYEPKQIPLEQAYIVKNLLNLWGLKAQI